MLCRVMSLLWNHFSRNNVGIITIYILRDFYSLIRYRDESHFGQLGTEMDLILVN